MGPDPHSKAHLIADTEKRMAYESLRNSALRGLALAQFMMGELCRSGTLVPADEAEARHWYQRASLQAYGPATYELGLMYRDGRGGLPRDDDEYFSCIHKAAQQGSEQASTLMPLIEPGRRPQR